MPPPPSASAASRFCTALTRYCWTLTPPPISRVHILTSEPVPGGCTMTTVGASCEVHLMLRGLVDVGKEVARLEEKIEKLDGQIAKVKKMMDMENYEEKVCC